MQHTARTLWWLEDINRHCQTASRLSLSSPRSHKPPAQSPLAATQTAVTPPTPEPNRYVGAGRDYPFTGTSTTYYSQSTAIDLAQTNLHNQAAAFWESSYKAEIRWRDPSCEASSSSANQYLCTVDAMVNCYVNRCDQAFCGTRN